MKKRLLSLALAAAMALSLGVGALADNVDTFSGDSFTKDAGSTSYGTTSADGTTKFDVTSTVSLSGTGNSDTKVYSVDVDWTMTGGVYTRTDRYNWNPETLKYDAADPVKGTGSATNGTAAITVTNRSNEAVYYTIAYDPATDLGQTVSAESSSNSKTGTLASAASGATHTSAGIARSTVYNGTLTYTDAYTAALQSAVSDSTGTMGTYTVTIGKVPDLTAADAIKAGNSAEILFGGGIYTPDAAIKYYDIQYTVNEDNTISITSYTIDDEAQDTSSISAVIVGNSLVISPVLETSGKLTIDTVNSTYTYSSDTDDGYYADCSDLLQVNGFSVSLTNATPRPTYYTIKSEDYDEHCMTKDPAGEYNYVLRGRDYTVSYHITDTSLYGFFSDSAIKVLDDDTGDEISCTITISDDGLDATVTITAANITNDIEIDFDW